MTGATDGRHSAQYRECPIRYVEQFDQADVYGDLLGDFSPPTANALDCVTVDFAGTGNA